MAFVKDENNSMLKEVFENNMKLKEVHMELYPANPYDNLSMIPFMLLSRTVEKNVTVVNYDDRFMFRKNDMCGTYFMNILFSKIEYSVRSSCS